MQETLYAEVSGALAPGEDPQWKKHTDGALLYLNAVIKETLRPAPAVPNDLKNCLEDDVLPSGFQVKKGWTVQWNQWDLSRHHKYWEQPLRFWPERWLTTPSDPTIPKPPSTNNPPWCPFQYGPRTCLGIRMATVSLEAMLAQLVKHFRFEPSAELPVPKASITLAAKDGIKLLIHRR